MAPIPKHARCHLCGSHAPLRQSHIFPKFYWEWLKFKTRYATVGFSDKAKLDEGRMWPTAYALQELTAAEERKIGALVRKAVR